MAFTDRIVQYPGRVKMTPVSGQTDVYDMTAQEGTVTTEGTLLNAANLNAQTQLDSAVLEQFQSAGMAGQYQNDMSNALSFIINGAVITEETTDGNWHTRKWSNGMVEAWGSITHSAVAGSVWAAPIYYYDMTVNLPSVFENAPDNIQLTNANAQWVTLGTNAVTASTFNVRLIKPTSGSQAVTFKVYAVKYPTA